MHPEGGEAYFRELCEQIGVALVATDRSLNIQTWNAAAGRMFGAAADRMTGTSVISIIPKDRRIPAERMFREALALGETSELEFQHRDSHGEARELSGTIAPVVSETGDRIGASICIRDITRRIHLQAELHESRKMASLGAMAGAIAHHFNNILGGVVTSIDFAGDCSDIALTKRVLGQTSRALMRAAVLVNGLLAFAEGTPCVDDLSDLTELMNELVDELEREIEGRKIEFTLNLPTLPVVPVPRTQLRTMLRNIAQNAIEAMPNGGSLLMDVSVSESAVVIAISDTGHGLDKDTQSRIFEPFWSTKGDRALGSTATGMGLAIAHGLAQVIGATITVASELNKGSTFTVTIPHPSESASSDVQSG
jgi:PAS domain S-box-containing protein